MELIKPSILNTPWAYHGPVRLSCCSKRSFSMCSAKEWSAKRCFSFRTWSHPPEKHSEVENPDWKKWEIPDGFPQFGWNHFLKCWKNGLRNPRFARKLTMNWCKWEVANPRLMAFGLRNHRAIGEAIYHVVINMASGEIPCLYNGDFLFNFISKVAAKSNMSNNAPQHFGLWFQP